MTLRWIQREGTGRLISNRDPKTDKAGIGSFLEMYETLSFFPLKFRTQGLRFLSLMASLCYGELCGGPRGTPSYKAK